MHAAGCGHQNRKLEFGNWIWKLEIGNWKWKLEMEYGNWKLEIGKWKVESGMAPIGHRTIRPYDCFSGTLCIARARLIIIINDLRPTLVNSIYKRVKNVYKCSQHTGHTVQKKS